MMHNLADIGIKRKMKADEIHNVYGHYWNKMLFSKYAKEFPEERLFHLNRSGFAGSQRYSIFPWSGDVSRRWSGLRAQLPVMLGMSMSCSLLLILMDFQQEIIISQLIFQESRLILQLNKLRD